MAFGIQGLISSFDIGIGARLVRAILVVAFAALAFGLFAAAQFRGLTDPAAMEQAQVARSLAAGEGFTTRCVRPVDLGRLKIQAEGEALQPIPELRQAPAYPWLLSLGFRWMKPSFASGTRGAIIEAERRVIIPLGILLGALTAVFVLLLGARLFDWDVGVLAMSLFLVSEGALRAGISGTALPLQMLLGIAGIYAAVCTVQASAGNRPVGLSILLACVTGGLCGLGVLSGYALVVLLPAIGLFLLLGCRRVPWAMVSLFLVCALGVTAPWLWRNARLCGDVFGLAPLRMLHDSFVSAGDSIERTVGVNLRGLFVYRAMQRKLLAGLGSSTPGALTAAGGLAVSALFLVSFVGSFERDEANRLRWCLALALLVVLPATVLLGSTSVVVILLPEIVIFAAAYLYVAMDSHGLINTGWQPLAIWLLIVLTALPALTTMLAGRPAWPYPPVHAPLVAFVGNTLETDEAICTDIPWATAWYATRTSLLLPETVEAMQEIHEKRGRISALYLTTETADRAYVSELQTGRWQSWLPLLDRRIPEGFPFREGIDLPAGSRAQLLLTDRVRW